MKALAGFALLVLAESALFVLPLLPAFDELRRKRDAKPLEVIQKHAGDIAYFARVFRNYIAPVQERLRQCAESRTTGWGRLKNGEEYVLLGDDRRPFSSAANLQGSGCHWLIAAGINLALPNGVNFAKEIYSAKSLMGGERNRFRAILCDQDVHLRKDSETMRWAHADGQLRADAGCRLYGRTSSGSEILLAPPCLFQRMHAPRIVMGSARPKTCEAADAIRLEKTGEHKTPLTRRLAEGNVEIGSGEVVTENLVARGTLRLRAGSQVLGSVKGYRSVVLDERVHVRGSLISSGELHIGTECRVGGPILAEHQVQIASGTICGAPHFPTTVSSPVVQAMEGTVFFGTVWARERGEVVPRT